MTVNAIYQFPSGFLWGCATASHQVEGDNRNDWSVWEQTPGRIFENHRSGRACEWWQGRYQEDFERAAGMYNNAQRISIEWSRIEPEPGKFDPAAMTFYRDMLESLTNLGMRPMVTLHHFTLPIWAAERGGWLWEELPGRFATYAQHVVSALGDRCNLWCTLNEPNVQVIHGYLFGTWAPGERSLGKMARAAIGLLQGHSAAYRAIKDVRPDAQVGLAHHMVNIKPRAPRWLNALPTRVIDGLFNKGVLNALRSGVANFIGARKTAIPGLQGAMDWIGLQYYSEQWAGFSLSSPGTAFISYTVPHDMPIGPKNWGGLQPSATFNQVRRLYETLEKPIYITEAGVPDPEDTVRRPYLIEAIQATWKAACYNYPVKGFFAWTLIDNFEWAEGYDPRYSFGFYSVDRETQARTARPSADLYMRIAAKNGLTAEMVEQHAPEIMDKVFPGAPGKNNVKLKPR